MAATKKSSKSAGTKTSSATKTSASKKTSAKADAAPKTMLGKAGKTMTDAGKAVSKTTKKVLKGASEMMEPVGRALGVTKAPKRKSAKTAGSTTAKQSTKKKGS